MKIIIETEPTPQRVAAAWQLYAHAFWDLDTRTVQRHLMTRAEFDQVMGDPAVDKYLAVDDAGETVHGLATYTNHLDAMPLISPRYFEHHWPDLYAQGHIWYCGFVAVSPDAPDGTFSAMVEAMYRVAEEVGGLISLDICQFNIAVRRLDRVVALILHRISEGRCYSRQIDAQRFFAYETAPAAA